MTTKKLACKQGLTGIVVCAAVLSLWTNPRGAAAQAAAASAELPSQEISLTDLRAESRIHKLDLRESVRTGVSPTYTQDIDRNQRYREVYDLRLRQGQAIQIDLSSKDFDGLLRVYDENGKLVAQNDDWGGNTNSRLYLATLSRGRERFFLVVTAAQPREGDFELQIREREPPKSAQIRPISIGQVIAGQLKPTSTLSLESQVVYDSYTFEGTAGDVVKLVATPADAPVLLELAHGQDKPFRAGTKLPGRPVTIYGALRWTGRYDLTVSGSPSATAAYQLEFSRLGPATVDAVPVAVRAGQEINNQFSPASPIFPGTDRPFTLYRFDGQKGEAISAVVETSESTVQQRGLTPVTVDIGVDSPVGFATALPAMRNSRSSATARFERDGWVFIRVLGPPAATTSYKLRINHIEAVQPALTAE